MKAFKQMALAALILAPTLATAQRRVETSVEADFVSHYMWRGQDKGGFSIQPTAKASWQGLSLKAEGNAGLDKSDPTELDLTLGYERWGFNLGVTDYWQSGHDTEDRYFYYDEKLSGHQFEGNVGYTCPYFSLQAYTIFWGSDFKISGDRAYSTYVELSVPFRLGSVDWMLKAGITPMESAGYNETEIVSTIIGDLTVNNPVHFYAEGFACNMASLRATKDVRICSDLRTPVFAEINTNPYLKKATLLFGFSIKPF